MGLPALFTDVFSPTLYSSILLLVPITLDKILYLPTHVVLVFTDSFTKKFHKDMNIVQDSLLISLLTWKNLCYGNFFIEQHKANFFLRNNNSKMYVNRNFMLWSVRDGYSFEVVFSKPRTFPSTDFAVVADYQIAPRIVALA